MHCGYVVKIEELRKHSNADRLQIATFFGNDCIVSLDAQVGDIGVYFPSDLQLSPEYCEVNDLVRRKDENGNPCGGYLDPDKRNIRPLKLRGEKSDGLFMPISSFDYCFDNDEDRNSALCIGNTVEVLNGHLICNKYIPKTNNKHHYNNSKKIKIFKEPYAPLFSEHIDTEQLNYNLSAFKLGDLIEITLKMHGTSQRTGYLPVFKGYKKTFLERLLRRKGTPIYEYDYVSGTRRVVLENFNGEGFYGSNSFRSQHHEKFVGKLHKGETVYYEVVGFTDDGTPIMANGNNEKIDKEFVKKYGKETVFSYGCSPSGSRKLIRKDELGVFTITEDCPKSDLYVYRMTLTTEEGHVVEYTPDYMRYRCEQIGVKSVPVMWKGYIPSDLFDRARAEEEPDMNSAGDYVKWEAEQYYDGPDPVGKTHIREGVVCRIVNRPTFTAFKTKNFSFKLLSSIAIENIENVDTTNMSEDILSEL